MVKKMLVILLSSFVIGNVVAWFSGSAPIDFPKIEYSDVDRQQIDFFQQRLQNQEDDVDALLQLGQIYSYHNEIDKADQHLSRAYELESDNMEAKAAYYSNDGKLAGAMLDLSMGIYKLVRLKTAMSEVDKAAKQDKDNFSVRLIRLMTFSYVGEISGRFDRVFEDEAWFLSLMAEQPGSLPVQVEQLVYIALANAYMVKSQGSDVKDEATQKVAEYFSKASQLGECPLTASASCQQLNQFSIASGGI